MEDEVRRLVLSLRVRQLTNADFEALRQIRLEATRAIRLYERHGFRTIGKYPNSLHVNGRSYDELIMFRSVSSSD